MSFPKVRLKHPPPVRPNPEEMKPPKAAVDLPLEVVLPEKIYMVTEANIRVPQEVPAVYEDPLGPGPGADPKTYQRLAAYRRGWVDALQSLARELGYEWEDLIQVGQEEDNMERDALIDRIVKRLRAENEMVSGLSALFG
jgi:hypothetical protein